jgi:SAM-dependent methyltransferase
MTEPQYEHWAAGDAYEQFMGRWSWNVAARFLEWLTPAPGQRWLDVGCGTGALTRAVAAFTQPQGIVGLDPSRAFVRYANQHPTEASFLVAEGGALAFGSGVFDAVISGLALNFMPQPEQAMSDMHRVVKPGGVVAAYVWDYAGKMEFLRYFWDAAVELDANAAALHEGQRFPICQPGPLRQLWQAAGFNHVSVEALDIPTQFDDFESYWQPFTLGNFPAPHYALSLDEMQYNELRNRLQTVIPAEDDGSIHLIARVWAVRGYR